MADELLLDTGALVSLLDRSQRHHAAFVSFFGEWNRPVVSTEAVLTEATHLLGGLPGGRQAWVDRIKGRRRFEILPGGGRYLARPKLAYRPSRALSGTAHWTRPEANGRSFAQVDPCFARVGTRDDEEGVGR